MPSMYQLRLQLYIKRFIFLIVFLAVAAGFYFAFQSNQFDELKKKFLSVAEETNELTDEQQQQQSSVSGFEAFLDGANVQQLVLKSSELVDTPRANVLKRLDRQQQKIQVGEKLMEKSGDTRAVNIGIKTKLKALRTRELINFDNALASKDSLVELAQFADEHSKNADPDVVRQKGLGSLQAAMLLDLLGINPATSENPTLELFRDACADFVDDAVAGRAIFDFLKRVHVYGSETDYEAYISAFKSVFEKSEVEQLKLLASQISETLVESEFELVEIFDSIESLRDESIQKLRTQIIDALDSNLVSDHGLRRIYNRIQDVASVGKHEVAIELAELLQKKLDQMNSLPILSAGNLNTIKRLQVINATLDFSPVTTLNGEPFSFRHDDQVKAIVFISKETFGKSDEILFNILRTTNRFIHSKQFCTTAILIDDGDANKAIEEVKQVDKLVAIVDFAKLNIENEQGKALLDRLSLAEYPSIVLINGKNEVVGADISISDFDRQFFELMDPKQPPR